MRWPSRGFLSPQQRCLCCSWRHQLRSSSTTWCLLPRSRHHQRYAATHNPHSTLHIYTCTYRYRCILSTLRLCDAGFSGVLCLILEAEIKRCKGACRMHKTSMTSMVLLHKSGFSTQRPLQSVQHCQLPSFRQTFWCTIRIEPWRLA